jgi:phage shock protein PspC (stress-responsive transcriptional regulator)
MTNLETESEPLPPPTPTATPPQDHRWARSDDRIVLGVASGLGRALAIDPLFIRIAFVVLGLFSGVGVLVYVAAFLLLTDSPTSPPPSTVRRILGLLAAFASMTWLFNGGANLFDSGWVVAIGLLGAAAALWHGRAPADPRPAPPVVDAQTDSGGSSTTAQWEALSVKEPKQPRPPRSPLGLLTIGAATIVGALVWLVNENAGNRGVWAFGWATVVLGIGLVVGAFAGRARWLIIPAIATAMAALVASALSFAGVDLARHRGDHSVFITTDSTVAPIYKTGIGDFDMTIADNAPDVATQVDIGIGDLDVFVPERAHVQIDARVGLGEIDAMGTSRSGYRRVFHSDDNTAGTPTITLTLRVGVGKINVHRGSFFDGPVITVPALPAPPGGAGVQPSQVFGDGTVLYEDGSIRFADGGLIAANGTYRITIIGQNSDGSVQLDNGALVQADGTVVTPGGFVIHRPANPSGSTTLPPQVSPTTTAEVQP